MKHIKIVNESFGDFLDKISENKEILLTQEQFDIVKSFLDEFIKLKFNENFEYNISNPLRKNSISITWYDGPSQLKMQEYINPLLGIMRDKFSGSKIANDYESFKTAADELQNVLSDIKDELSKVDRKVSKEKGSVIVDDQGNEENYEIDVDSDNFDIINDIISKTLELDIEKVDTEDTESSDLSLFISSLSQITNVSYNRIISNNIKKSLLSKIDNDRQLYTYILSRIDIPSKAKSVRNVTISDDGTIKKVYFTTSIKDTSKSKITLDISVPLYEYTKKSEDSVQRRLYPMMNDQGEQLYGTLPFIFYGDTGYTTKGDVVYVLTNDKEIIKLIKNVKDKNITVDVNGVSYGLYLYDKTKNEAKTLINYIKSDIIDISDTGTLIDNAVYNAGDYTFMDDFKTSLGKISGNNKMGIYSGINKNDNRFIQIIFNKEAMSNYFEQSKKLASTIDTYLSDKLPSNFSIRFNIDEEIGDNNDIKQVDVYSLSNIDAINPKYSEGKYIYSISIVTGLSNDKIQILGKLLAKNI